MKILKFHLIYVHLRNHPRGNKSLTYEDGKNRTRIVEPDRTWPWSFLKFDWNYERDLEQQADDNNLQFAQKQFDLPLNLALNFYSNLNLLWD